MISQEISNLILESIRMILFVGRFVGIFVGVGVGASGQQFYSLNDGGNSMQPEPTNLTREEFELGTNISFPFIV